MPTPTKKKRTRSKLGRGLSALVDQSALGAGGVEVAPELGTKQIANILKDARRSSSQDADPHTQIFEIDVMRVVPNPHQPRRDFSEESLEELAQSIAEHGLLQPIVVRVDRSGGDDRYELIAGERRWRASCRTGKQVIRAIVLDVDDAVSAQLALVENIQREDLNPIEQAYGYSALASAFSMTQEQIAAKVGINRSSVANMLRLLELDEHIQSLIASGSLGRGHGKSLLSCKDFDRRLQLAKQAAAEHWTVRQLEHAISTAEIGMEDPQMPQSGDGGGRNSGSGQGRPSRIESVLRDLEKQLGEELGTKVWLKADRSGTKGTISIAFYGLDHFDGLMNRLGIDGNHELGQEE